MPGSAKRCGTRQTPTPEPSVIKPPSPGAESPRDLAAAAAPPRVAPERKRDARPRAESADEARPRADSANEARREAPASFTAPRTADETGTLADARASARAEREAKDLDAARERRIESAQAKVAAEPAPARAPAPAPAAAAGVAQAPASSVASVAPASASPPVGAAAVAPLRQGRAAPLRALIEALGEEPPRWRWQRDGTGERALTAPLQAWLQELDRALASRTLNTDSAALALAPDPGQTQELRLLRDGGVQAVVRFDADGRIRVEIAGEAPLTAQLPAARTSALRRALDDATR